MKQQRRFTKEFEEEAVRLVQTSGRTQREIAGDLGIGLSTLVRWIGRSRDRHAGCRMRDTGVMARVLPRAPTKSLAISFRVTAAGGS
jgi:transposase-like protein